MDHTNCHVEAATKLVNKSSVTEYAKAELRISGMGCQNCANRVHNSLLQQKGVLEVTVDLQTHSAHVAYDAGRASVEALVAAVSAAGNDGHHNYSATLIGQA